MTEPGWRADPTQRFELRWFDGRRWTKRVRVGDAEAIDTLSVPNDLQPPPPRQAGDEAGWRPDPQVPGQERFFDGHAWTAATRRRGRRQDRPGMRAWPVPRIVVAAGVLVLLVVVTAALVLLR